MANGFFSRVRGDEVKKYLIYTFIVAIIATAVMALAVFLFEYTNESSYKLLASAAIISVATFISLASYNNKVKLLKNVGVYGALVSGAYLVYRIIVEQPIFGIGGYSEQILKYMLVLGVISFLIGHQTFLSGKKTKYTLSSIAYFTTIASMLVVAYAIIAQIFSLQEVNEKLLILAVIFDILGTALIPILNKLRK